MHSPWAEAKRDTSKAIWRTKGTSTSKASMGKGMGNSLALARLAVKVAMAPIQCEIRASTLPAREEANSQASVNERRRTKSSSVTTSAISALEDAEAENANSEEEDAVTAEETAVAEEAALASILLESFSSWLPTSPYCLSES